MGRLIAVGDLHGCLYSLKLLLTKIEPTKEDRFVFIGDYIDRGAWVYELIEFLIEFAEEYDCVFLKGNHEDMWLKDLMYKRADWDNHRMFIYNGGKATLHSYRKQGFFNPTRWDDDELTLEMLPKKHRDFYTNLKVRYDEDEFIFVHAGLRPGVEDIYQADHDLMWIRDTFLYDNLTDDFGGKTIVHGHTPMNPGDIQRYYHDKYPNKINVDTGCVFGDELRATDVRTRRTWHVGQVLRDKAKT